MLGEHRRTAGTIASLQVFAMLMTLAVPSANLLADEGDITPQRQLAAPGAKDQDDVCFWLNSREPSQSTIIASDKSANAVFVYALDGRLLQTLAVTKPGNIDSRQRVILDGKPTDVVVVNQRSDGFRLRIFRVDPESRQLVALDRGNVTTGPNYGGCLSLHRRSGKLTFICTSESGTVEQHELAGDGSGGIVGKLVRSWPLGKCEGAVADDETGALFITEETRGIWKFDADPELPAMGQLIAQVGEKDGLAGDLEGITIDRHSKGRACLLVSDQGRSRFVAFDLAAPHPRIGEFRIAGARDTDGIDVLPISLGTEFPDGIFACHTDLGARSVQLSSLAEIRRRLAR
jgi:myo-inositol-hexaphosphate 3-phosphohydrolase